MVPEKSQRRRPRKKAEDKKPIVQSGGTENVNKEFVNIIQEIAKQGVQSREAVQAIAEMHGTWERIVSMVDSGATVPVMPPDIGSQYKVEESFGSKNGHLFGVANGNEIPNLGQKFLPVMTKEQTLQGYPSQCADVTMALQSVVHMNKGKKGVWLYGADSFAVDMETGEVNAIDFDGKRFTMEHWVVPPDELENVVAQVWQSDFAGHQW
jgi:hypothetical protein